MDRLKELDQKLAADPNNEQRDREWLLEQKAKLLFESAIPKRDIEKLRLAIACLDDAHKVLCSYFPDGQLSVNPYKRTRDFYAETLEGWEKKK